MIRGTVSKISRICIVLAILGIVLIACLSGYSLWLDKQPKFHDVTIELGSELPPVEDFLTKYAFHKRIEMLTDPAEIDLSHAGTQTLTFRHGKKQEEVLLTIQDTIPPKAVVQEVTVNINDAITPELFIKEMIDYSQVSAEFVYPPKTPEGYGEDTVEIRLTDESGNETVVQSKLYFCWLQHSFYLELGETLTKCDLLLNGEKDAALLDQAEIDLINETGLGTYTVTSISDGMEWFCTVYVQDTTPPDLQVKDVSIYQGYTASLQNFLVSATDVSGTVDVKMVSPLNFNTVGTQTVLIEATDVNGNVARKEAAFTIKADTKPPYFINIGEITVEKHQNIDYVAGVSAYDTETGSVNFTYNANNVNLSKPGTYYVTYTASDKAGNTATYRRKITVNHDAEDTAMLVKSVAAELENDPELIRDYVRKTIKYSTDWGGEDPVWFGFQNKKGNCYVHALCLQVLLTEKGYNTQLIWVTDKTHYWLVIELEGKWYHIDATPSNNTHSKYSLMTDEQRYETLSGRDWDRSAWPICGGSV